jgi:peptide/nickel transport system ATP-binding protein
MADAITLPDVVNTAPPPAPLLEAFLSAVPVPDPEAARKRIILKGDVPSPINPPRAANATPTAPTRSTAALRRAPKWREVLPGYRVACHLREVQTAAFTQAAAVPV